MRKLFITGFTLIEVMIAAAILSILMAVALPSYRAHIISSQRSTGISAIMDVASRQNQYFSNNKRYASALTDLGLPASYYVDGNGTSTSGDALYLLSLSGVTTTAFTVNATPQNEMATEDTDCGTYSLTETGAQTVSGSGGVDQCW